MGSNRVYFVHSFRATREEANREWVAATCGYSSEFVAAVAKEKVVATQFHPEKSGPVGLDVYKAFLKGEALGVTAEGKAVPGGPGGAGLAENTFCLLTYSTIGAVDAFLC